MSARPIPIRTVAFRVPGESRVYPSKLTVYYAIAKRLVIEKYPPSLHHSTPLVPDGWTNELAQRRTEKAERLFLTAGYLDGAYDRSAFFDERKWKRFVHRVARFLRFVDQRRGLEGACRELHTGRPPDDEHARLQRELEDAERGAVRLLELADALRAEIARRQAESSR